ncbi:hypothetical protein ACFPRL_21200 [Pseudoclavibacter helvolus]
MRPRRRRRAAGRGSASRRAATHRPRRWRSSRPAGPARAWSPESGRGR